MSLWYHYRIPPVANREFFSSLLNCDFLFWSYLLSYRPLKLLLFVLLQLQAGSCVLRVAQAQCKYRLYPRDLSIKRGM